MKDYISHHYVPQWYQKNFLTHGKSKLNYLDLKPDLVRDKQGKAVIIKGRNLYRDSLLKWSPKRCFCIDNLYTTLVNGQDYTGVERIFFGKIDDRGKKAVDYFKNFSHPSIDPTHLNNFLTYLSTQKLRTPKGLSDFKSKVLARNNTELMARLQYYKDLHNAIWSESIWSICDVDDQRIGFLLSDHPVTVYNHAAFPSSAACREHGDPLITQNGTHTLFPLSDKRILIITNLSWARNPYQNPLHLSFRTLF